KADLRATARALPQAESIFAAPRQRLDLATARLAPALARNARSHESRLALLGQRLLSQSPAARVARQQTHLAALASRLAQARASLVNREQVQLARRRAKLEALEVGLVRGFRQGLTRRSEKLASLWQLAASLGPEAVLARGYVMVLRADGTLVRTPDVEAGTGLNLRFASGTLAVTADGGAAKPARPKPPAREPGKQGDLF
ncbi:MAG: exodeoxyribonuclease VII large subunit, partial [Bosea sp. (in: a-proteobacteria)]